MSPAEREYRAIAAIAIGVGLASALTPRTMLRAFGLDPGSLNGEAALGWRMFAARNLVVGSAVLAGSPAARDMVLAVQALDQTAFWWGRARGEIPTRAAVMASATSGAVVALALRARALEGVEAA